jgi:hypothetical protein
MIDISCDPAKTAAGHSAVLEGRLRIRSSPGSARPGRPIYVRELKSVFAADLVTGTGAYLDAEGLSGMMAKN